MSRPRFERGTHIAWLIDAERGYREAGTSHWELVDVASLPGGRPRAMDAQKVRIIDAIAGDVDVPATTLEPSTDPAKVIIVSDVDLVVQEYGDTTPHTAGDAVEVPYGSVVRAGHVLMAPLYAEQMQSLNDGRMILPVIGERTTVEERVDAGDEAARVRASLAKSRSWILFVFIGLVFVSGLLAVILVKRSNPSLRSDRVLMVAQGFTKDLHGPARDMLARKIQSAGLAVEGVPRDKALPDSPTVAQLETVARAQGAGQAVLLVAEAVEQLAHDETSHQRQFLRTTARILSVGEEELGPELGVTLARTGGFWDDDVSLAEEAVDTLWPEIAQHLMLDTSLDTHVATLRSSSSRPRGADLLLGAHDAARAHRDAASQRTSRCEVDGREHLSDTTAGAALRCLSSPCSEEYPVGLTPDGAKALIQVRSDRAFFSLDRSPALAFADAPQRLDLVDVATGERRTLAIVEAFHGQSALTEDGRYTFFSEVMGRGRRLVKVALATGESEVVKRIRVHPLFFGHSEKTVASPDGRWHAYFTYEWPYGDGRWVRIADHLGREVTAKTGAAVEIRAISLTLQGEDQPSEILVVRVNRFVESSSNEQTEWYEQSKTPRHEHIALVDPVSGAALAHLGDPDHLARGIFGVRENTSLFFSYGPPEVDDESPPVHEDCGLARYDSATKALTYVKTTVCLGEGRVTAEGTLLTSADIDGQGPRLVTVDPETGALHRLTGNEVDEGPPFVARDGRWVLFARGGASDGRHNVVGTCVLDVGSVR